MCYNLAKYILANRNIKMGQTHHVLLLAKFPTSGDVILHIILVRLLIHPDMTNL